MEISRMGPLWAARATQGGVALTLLAALTIWTAAHPDAWPWLVALLLLPDLPLLAGMRQDGVRGRLNRRAVPAYNALHVFPGPILVGAAAFIAGPIATTAALAWGLHVAADRAMGFGLRTPSGDQRGAEQA